MYIKKLCFVNTHRVVRYGTVMFANVLQKPIFFLNRQHCIIHLKKGMVVDIRQVCYFRVNIKYGDSQQRYYLFGFNNTERQVGKFKPRVLDQRNEKVFCCSFVNKKDLEKLILKRFWQISRPYQDIFLVAIFHSPQERI